MRYRTQLERERQAAARRDDKSNQNKHVRLMQAEKNMRDYEEAYKALHGVEITLTERIGFIQIGAKRYRYNLLPGLTNKLWAEVQDKNNVEQD